MSGQQDPWDDGEWRSNPPVLASALGRWVRAECPRDFFFIDIDEVSYRRETKILRLMESKNPTEAVTDSQRELLPIYALLVEAGIRQRVVRDGSGVFIVRIDPEDVGAGGSVRRVHPAGTFAVGEEYQLRGKEWMDFICSRTLDFPLD